MLRAIGGMKGPVAAAVAASGGSISPSLCPSWSLAEVELKAIGGVEALQLTLASDISASDGDSSVGHSEHISSVGPHVRAYLEHLLRTVGPDFMIGDDLTVGSCLATLEVVMDRYVGGVLWACATAHHYDNERSVSAERLAQLIKIYEHNPQIIDETPQKHDITVMVAAQDGQGMYTKKFKTTAFEILQKPLGQLNQHFWNVMDTLRQVDTRTDLVKTETKKALYLLAYFHVCGLFSGESPPEGEEKTWRDDEMPSMQAVEVRLPEYDGSLGDVQKDDGNLGKLIKQWKDLGFKNTSVPNVSFHHQGSPELVRGSYYAHSIETTEKRRYKDGTLFTIKISLTKGQIRDDQFTSRDNDSSLTLKLFWSVAENKWNWIEGRGTAAEEAEKQRKTEQQRAAKHETAVALGQNLQLVKKIQPQLANIVKEKKGENFVGEAAKTIKEDIKSVGSKDELVNLLKEKLTANGVINLFRKMLLPGEPMDKNKMVMIQKIVDAR